MAEARAGKVICPSWEPVYFISFWRPDGRNSAQRYCRVVDWLSIRQFRRFCSCPGNSSASPAWKISWARATISASYAIQRVSDGLSTSSHDLAPGPLRVLFLAAEPLDFEREESEILLVAEGLDVILEISDTGTLEELKSLAEAFRPHLVHLVGQVRMTGVQALFSLPGTGGRLSPRSAVELAGALKNSGVECLILGGRQKEPTFAQGLLSQQLAEHIPLVLAWNGSTASALSFYRFHCKGPTSGYSSKSHRSRDAKRAAGKRSPLFLSFMRPEINPEINPGSSIPNEWPAFRPLSAKSRLHCPA